MRNLSIFFIFFLPFLVTGGEPIQRYVTVELQGYLGNQLFQVAAAYAHAKKTRAEALFPDFIQNEEWAISHFYERVFHRMNVNDLPFPPTYTYKEATYQYRPLPHNVRGLRLNGYFFSELYFKAYKKEIQTLFAPSDDILQTLQERWGHLLARSNVVGVHVRTYHDADPDHTLHVFVSWDYFKRAMDTFPEETTFLVCSDRMDLCKAGLADVSKKLIFIEDNEDDVEDFYLLTLCDHHILSNSTFSWWSAYLNQNPEKIVIAPDVWFPTQNKDESTLLPKKWITLPYTPSNPEDL